jgi:penicillin-binding protein 1C
MKHKSWFVLPPTQAYYYQLKNPFYKVLPPYRSDCIPNSKTDMEFVGLFSNEQIFLPKDFDEKKNSLILKIKHRIPETQIYWYLDTDFIKVTQGIHEVAIQPKKGEHTVTVVDGLGNEIKKTFNILK